MKIIEPYVEILDEIDGAEMLKKIELAGRVCYKSEDKITDDSAERFVRNIIKRGHESVLEHEKITVRFVCDRGVSHELVRHRLASFSQESTRYCDYSPTGNAGELTFIKPCFLDNDDALYGIWLETMENSEIAYRALRVMGAKPEEARSILPNSLKTEVVMTANIREWRHILRLRTAKAAHPQMRQVMNMLRDQLVEKIPVIFDEFKEDK